MKLRAKHNLDEVFGQLDDVADQIMVATVRTVNKLADQAQTAGFRKIADVYKIGPRTMDQYARTKLAGIEDLEATITVKGRGFPMSVFQPLRTGKGISVLIKGKRVLIPHAFFIPRAGARVFARGGYGGKGARKPTGESFGPFQFNRSRLPINQLFTFAPPDAFSNPDVVETMNDRVEAQAKAVLTHEIKFAVRTR